MIEVLNKVGKCPHCGSADGRHYSVEVPGDCLSNNAEDHSFYSDIYHKALPKVICGMCREYFEMCWIVSATMEQLLTAVNYSWHNDAIHELYKRVLANGGLVP